MFKSIMTASLLFACLAALTGTALACPCDDDADEALGQTAVVSMAALCPGDDDDTGFCPCDDDDEETTCPKEDSFCPGDDDEET